MDSLEDLWSDLKNVSRAKKGELTIKDFTDEDYEELYYTILEVLAPYIGENYEAWYERTKRSYHRFKAANSVTHDFYDPIYEKSLAEQSIREQLTLLKFYIYRRIGSAYKVKPQED